jgi:phosphopantothenoylcysteine decarboxylase/phosphopantothenate--cysteine ligase
VVVGFAAETERLLEHARDKLERKRLDLIVANDVSAPDSGFEVDTNRAVLLDAHGGTEALPLMSKDDLAGVICDRIAALHSSAGAGPSYDSAAPAQEDPDE